MSWKDNLRKVEPYIAGEQPKMNNLIKLNTNENPYGPGEKVAKAILDFDVNTLNLYPNPDAEDLRHALAKLHQVKDEQVFIGNGSDEVLALTFLTCFNSSKPLLFPDITYSFYPVYCQLYGINYETIPLQDDFSINTQDYLRDNGGIIFPNPNAPTSLGLDANEIEALIKNNPNSVVVIDEAYIDFGGESVLPLIDKYDNLLVIRTFSKYRSLAGIRLGAAYGSKDIIARLYDVKNSFNSYPIDRLAQAIGKASIEDEQVIRSHANQVIATRERITKELEALGFEVPHSQANFIFPKHNRVSAEYLFKKLREKGIIVRYFNKPRIHNHLRITIGTDDQMDRFLTVLKDILESA